MKIIISDYARPFIEKAQELKTQYDMGFKDEGPPFPPYLKLQQELNDLYKEHGWLRAAVLSIENKDLIARSCLVDKLEICPDEELSKSATEINIEKDSFFLDIKKVS